MSRAADSYHGPALRRLPRACRQAPAPCASVVLGSWARRGGLRRAWRRPGRGCEARAGAEPRSSAFAFRFPAAAHSARQARRVLWAPTSREQACLARAAPLRGSSEGPPAWARRGGSPGEVRAAAPCCVSRCGPGEESAALVRSPPLGAAADWAAPHGRLEGHAGQKWTRPEARAAPDPERPREALRAGRRRRALTSRTWKAATALLFCDERGDERTVAPTR